MEFSFKNIAIAVVIATAVVGVIVVGSSSSLKNRIAVDYSKSSAAPAPLLFTGAGAHTLQVNNLNVTGTLGVGTTNPGYAKVRIYNNLSGGPSAFVLLENPSTAKEAISGFAVQGESDTRFIGMYYINSNSNQPYITWRPSSGVLMTGYEATGGLVLATSASAPIIFAAGIGTQGTGESMRINSNGNVGIGTTNPGSKLEVVGGSRFSGGRNLFTDVEGAERIRVGAAWGVPGFYSEDAQDLVLGVDVNHKAYIGTLGNFMTVQGDGKVGIGTENPNAKLQVSGGDAAISSQGSGMILRATDGPNCYRVTVNNAGALAAALVTCP